MRVSCPSCSCSFEVSDKAPGGAATCPSCRSRVALPAAASRIPSGFYAVINKQQAGPFSSEDFRRQVEGGQITGRTFVWRGGMAEWKRARDVPELRAIFEAPVAEPTPPPRPAAPKPAPAPAPRQEVPRDGPAKASKDKRDKKKRGAPAAEHKAAPAEQEAQREDPFAAAVQQSQPANANPFDSMASDYSDPNQPMVIGEQTRFFMLEAGVTEKQRNPLWKKLLFVFLLIGVPGITVFALSQIKVERIQINEATGEEEIVEVSMLSEGVAGLREKLLGTDKKEEEQVAQKARRPRRPKPKAPPKEAVAAEEKGPTFRQEEGSDTFIARPDFDFRRAGSDTERARALYQSGDMKMSGPAMRRDAEKQAVDGKAGLEATVIAEVIGKNQTAFQRCVENELRRNPTFKGGKINITLTIGSSGSVTKATIDRPEIDGTDVGKCIRQGARRIVFPSFEGDAFDVEVPLVLTSGG